MQVVPSDAIQHVHIEMLPPVLDLHLSRFCYDAAEIKFDKYIQFVLELKIPGTIFIFVLPCGNPRLRIPITWLLQAA